MVRSSSHEWNGGPQRAAVSGMEGLKEQPQAEEVGQKAKRLKEERNRQRIEDRGMQQTR